MGREEHAEATADPQTRVGMAETPGPKQAIAKRDKKREQTNRSIGKTSVSRESLTRYVFHGLMFIVWLVLERTATVMNKPQFFTTSKKIHSNISTTPFFVAHYLLRNTPAQA